MANPPITIGPFNSVPAPGSPIRSDWPQSISQYVTPLATARSVAGAAAIANQGVAINPSADLGNLPVSLYLLNYSALLSNPDDVNSANDIIVTAALFVGGAQVATSVYRGRPGTMYLNSIINVQSTPKLVQLTLTLNSAGRLQVYADASNHQATVVRLAPGTVT